MRYLYKILIAFVAMIASSFHVGAGIYTAEHGWLDTNHACSSNPACQGAGIMEDFSVSYDDLNGQLSFSSTLSEKDGQYSTGFWLVLNGGGMPGGGGHVVGNEDEIAIIYGDLTQGDGALSVYVYDGTNGSDSWKDPNNFIGRYDQDFNVNHVNGPDANDGSTSFEFDIDLAKINSSDGKPNPDNWRGIEFSDDVGIWFHAFNGGVTYSNDGSIDSMNYGNNFGMFDTDHYGTNYSDSPSYSVPEAPTLILFVLGFCGLLLREGNRQPLQSS
ncbi:hypothetical protein [Echinimonas agarilytica]|uniref:PEP-CTERM protein-sorting domain-containing protein n=1 Tax=Echinimonas agarilytica TaxID=1215918 RepID=A0AA42B801_9GAMM|nr:hypothetical protein [Echinimonas agarilytica]MCM2680407.1 hypothetical protein [Echinimonas agarilytica]